MKNNYILNEAGEPEVCEDIIKWGQWFAISDTERMVRRDILAGGFMISTVFLAVDHNHAAGWNPEAEQCPVLWETMPLESRLDFQVRYFSKEDAIYGHTVAVEELKDDLRKLRTWRRAKKVLSSPDNKQGREYFSKKLA